ncbi:hypothetical protein H4R33_002454 [Dimargaris cristalligena]|nr:hypothetical protein H4R33_002454 [Dimargaris cristalligena]
MGFTSSNDANGQDPNRHDLRDSQSDLSIEGLAGSMADMRIGASKQPLQLDPPTQTGLLKLPDRGSDTRRKLAGLGSSGSLDSVESTSWKKKIGWNSGPKEQREAVYYSRKTGIRLFPPQYDYRTLVKYEQLTETKRYIIIGDVHGQLTDLKALLKETKFNRETDQVILAGDLIEITFDRPSRDWKSELKNLATLMPEKNLEYLRNCRLVYELPVMDNEKVLVVHAGMDVNKPVDNQDPNFAMYVPYLRSKTKFDGYEDYPRVWQKDWANRQGKDGTIVVYGHEEKWEPVIAKWTKGIDTICYKGGRLTAITYPGGEMTSVECTEYRGASSSNTRR